MKNTFTKEYLLENKGCYDTSQVNELPFKKDSITLKLLFDTLPVKDFNWFLVKKCELTLKEKRLFALHCAKQVLPIYETYYPKDNRVKDCIEATEEFLNGNISEDELRTKRAAAAYAAAYAATAAAYAAAYAAADATAAAYAAAYAATAAATAAAYAAYADAADAYAAYADAAYAAATADAAATAAADAAAAFKKSIWKFVKQLN